MDIYVPVEELKFGHSEDEMNCDRLEVTVGSDLYMEGIDCSVNLGVCSDECYFKKKAHSGSCIIYRTEDKIRHDCLNQSTHNNNCTKCDHELTARHNVQSTCCQCARISRAPHDVSESAYSHQFVHHCNMEHSDYKTSSSDRRLSLFNLEIKSVIFVFLLIVSGAA